MEKEIEQINHWLTTFSKLANEFAEIGDMPKQEYWKGQVMGACKVAALLNLGIDCDYYLRNLL